MDPVVLPVQDKLTPSEAVMGKTMVFSPGQDTESTLQESRKHLHRCHRHQTHRTTVETTWKTNINEIIAKNLGI